MIWIAAVVGWMIGGYMVIGTTGGIYYAICWNRHGRMIANLMLSELKVMLEDKLNKIVKSIIIPSLPYKGLNMHAYSIINKPICVIEFFCMWPVIEFHIITCFRQIKKEQGFFS